MFSVVTPNRNRVDSLKAVISSWASQQLISEIIVVDYGSERPIKIDDLPASRKTKIVRVEGTDEWRIGHASNIGIDFATNQHVCKLDSDVLINNSEWLAGLDLRSTFVRGHYQTPVPNGEVVFSKEHWEAVGGYNEWLSGYGFDDTDYYIRLRSLGLNKCYISPRALQTLTQPQAQRGRYESTYRFTRITDPTAKAAFDQYRNTVLAFMRTWDRSLRTPYVMLSQTPQCVSIHTNPMRDRYKFEEAIAEGLAALCFIGNDEAARRHVEGLMAWLINEAGGFGKRPEW